MALVFNAKKDITVMSPILISTPNNAQPAGTVQQDLNLIKIVIMSVQLVVDVQQAVQHLRIAQQGIIKIKNYKPHAVPAQKDISAMPKTYLQGQPLQLVQRDITAVAALKRNFRTPVLPEPIILLHIVQMRIPV